MSQYILCIVEDLFRESVRADKLDRRCFMFVLHRAVPECC